MGRLNNFSAKAVTAVKVYKRARLVPPDAFDNGGSLRPCCFLASGSKSGDAVLWLVLSRTVLLVI